MDAATAFREYNTAGVPSSGLREPDINEFRAWALGQEAAIRKTSVKVIVLAENSWGYRVPGAPDRWLDTPLRAALAAAFSASPPVLRNYSLGGKSIGVPSDPDRLTAKLAAMLANGDVAIVIGRNPINDINQGRTAAQILADIATVKSIANAYGAVLVQPSMPPFNNPAGVNTYTTSPDGGTRAVADAVNAGLAAIVGASNVVNLWAPFNDPANDGMLKSEYWLANDDRYHLNAAGAAVYAGLLAANPALVAAMADPNALVAALTTIARYLDPDATPRFRALVAGAMGGVVGDFNIYPIDPFSDGVGLFQAQPNTAAAGWSTSALISGAYRVARLAGGNPLPRLVVSGVTTENSYLYTPLWTAADGYVQTLTTAMWGGGVGTMLRTKLETAKITIEGFGGGGSSFLPIETQTDTLTIAGNNGNAARGRIGLGSGNQVTITGDSVGGKLGGLYWIPEADNTCSIGLGTHRYTVFYAASGTINTSDPNFKTEIQPVAASFAGLMLDALDPISFIFTDAKAERITEQAVDEDGNPVVDLVEEPVMEEVEEPYEEPEIVERDGARIVQMARKTRTVQRQKTEMLPVHDADGEPIIDHIPAMGKEGEEGYVPARDEPRLRPVPVFRTVGKPRMETRTVYSPGARRHLGFSAQDVEDALRKAGVDDPWTLAMLTRDDPNDPNSRRGLRESHFIPILWAALKDARERIAALEAGKGKRR